MRVSILVVSRSSRLLNGMLESINAATDLLSEQAEILCSWNGETAEEGAIKNDSRFRFRIANRDSYSFSKNVNYLAKQAIGEYLLLINDDIILDEGSIDSAISFLEKEKSVGIVGARLRDNQGKLQHAGILFDECHEPYHLLEGIIAADSEALIQTDYKVPAVTGALLAIKRVNFLDLLLNETYKVCGEDIEICLDMQEKKSLEVFYLSGFSGIHYSSATRNNTSQHGNNKYDLKMMKNRRKKFLDNIEKSKLKEEFFLCLAESTILRKLEKTSLDIVIDSNVALDSYKELSENTLKENILLRSELHRLKQALEDLESIEGQNNLLQLTRIRQEKEINEYKEKIKRIESSTYD